ncbi:hypothetical protein NLI96_g7545 [Meripilus lineatus]|uniref:Uncharacterized protein n=1 Tax=Meripilus lineatus TaxID=2056292 RepID=A0AAD5V0R2_9APHY|nr:hypothetical protein NLI96_g7545 [Physisporinus lineatus]
MWIFITQSDCSLHSRQKRNNLTLEPSPPPSQIVESRLGFIPMDACNDIDPNSRRTRVNIAISCISTIFLCTWVAFHPNIPAPGESKWKILRRRIGCMIGGILAPEIYVLLAARQFIAARHFAKIYRRWGWTLSHGFFALMGGFVIYDGKTADKIKFYDPEEFPGPSPFIDAFARDFISLEAFEHRLAAKDLESSNGSSPTQGFVHVLAALRYIESQSATLAQVAENSDPSIEQCIHQVEWYNDRLTNYGMDAMFSFYLKSERERQRSKGILNFLEASERDAIVTGLGKSEVTDYATTTEISDGTKGSASSHTTDPAIENSILRSLVPRINEQDIQDKSKSDMLTKTIALFQVAWFILQLCARYHENLVITELEILTLAFCVLNFATYALWWKKPFAVARGYAIRWKDDGWEVIAPPTPFHVETSQVSWYNWCRVVWTSVLRPATYTSLWKNLSAEAGRCVRRRDNNPEATGPLSLPVETRTRQLPWDQRFGRWISGMRPKVDIGDWFKTAGDAIQTSFKTIGDVIRKGNKLVTIQIPRGQTLVHGEDKRVSTLTALAEILHWLDRTPPDGLRLVQTDVARHSRAYRICGDGDVDTLPSCDCVQTSDSGANSRTGVLVAMRFNGQHTEGMHTEGIKHTDRRGDVDRSRTEGDFERPSSEADNGHSF